jgi:hypothetical protein
MSTFRQFDQGAEMAQKQACDARQPAYVPELNQVPKSETEMQSLLRIMSEHRQGIASASDKLQRIADLIYGENPPIPCASGQKAYPAGYIGDFSANIESTTAELSRLHTVIARFSMLA